MSLWAQPGLDMLGTEGGVAPGPALKEPGGDRGVQREQDAWAGEPQRGCWPCIQRLEEGMSLRNVTGEGAEDITC